MHPETAFQTLQACSGCVAQRCVFFSHLCVGSLLLALHPPVPFLLALTLITLTPLKFITLTPLTLIPLTLTLSQSYWRPQQRSRSQWHW